MKRIILLLSIFLASCASNKPVETDLSTIRARSDAAGDELQNRIKDKNVSQAKKSNSTIDSSKLEITAESDKNESKDVWRDGDWIVSVAEAQEVNISRDEAMRNALDNARNKAIKYVVGVNLSSATILSKNSVGDSLVEYFTGFTSAFSYGRIIEEQPPIWKQEEIAKDKFGLPVNRYIVTLHCKVQKEEGSPDPGFVLTFSIDKLNYTKNEQIKLTANASQDCYLTVFNIFEGEDTLLMLFPNKYDSNNKLKANASRRVPLESSGISFRALLPKGKAATHELIFGIATKNPVDFSVGLNKSAALIYNASAVTVVKEIAKKLVAIPLSP